MFDRTVRFGSVVRSNQEFGSVKTEFYRIELIKIWFSKFGSVRSVVRSNTILARFLVNTVFGSFLLTLPMIRNPDKKESGPPRRRIFDRSFYAPKNIFHCNSIKRTNDSIQIACRSTQFELQIAYHLSLFSLLLVFAHTGTR